jgi:DNA-binding HxlR family transcriptional regulator
MRLMGRLADRSSWITYGACPIEKTMGIVGSRNAMLTMREAFYGTRRFDDFAVAVGMSDATTAANLKALVSAGLLEKRPYREEGARTRAEYVLTPAGEDLMSVVFGLFDWGMKHASDPPPLALRHEGCAQEVGVRMVCECGVQPGPDDMELRIRRS